MKTFKPEDIEQFVHEHIQSKIDHNELHLTGINLKQPDNFEKEFKIYKNALFEGICNGIMLCGEKIEGVE